MLRLGILLPMLMEHLDRVGFSMLDMSASRGGALVALESVAVGPVFALPVLVACVWLFGSYEARRTAVMTGVAAILAMLTAHFASALIDRPRPFMAGVAPNLLDHAADSSFPSDHATLFFAIATVLARRPVPGLPGLGWSLAGLGLVVGLARVALGVHFPLDIMGAALIGTLAGLATERPRSSLDVLFRLGERLRSIVAQPAHRDDRQRGQDVDAHPAG